MNVFAYPLRYLRLEDEQENRLFLRDKTALIGSTFILALPFILFDMNFFGDRGFLDRFGSFSAVLTGFYIAALVGIASFASSLGGLDDVIAVGKIKGPDQAREMVDLMMADDRLFFLERETTVTPISSDTSSCVSSIASCRAGRVS